MYYNKAIGFTGDFIWTYKVDHCFFKRAEYFFINTWR